MATKTLAQIRDHLELILSLPAGDAFVDSQAELDDIMDGYFATAYSHDFPQLLTRRGIAITANVNRYSLPSNFRKARTIKIKGVEYREVELNNLYSTSQAYAIDLETNEIVLSQIPATASTAYTLSNAETAASAVTIELSSVTGIASLDEIWIDSVAGTDEFSLVSSVDTSAITITARLRANKSASDIIYLVDEIIDLQYYKTVTALSATTDVLLLPDPLDFVICNYAAYKAYTRLEEYDRAKGQFNLWKEQLDNYWTSFDKGSTGDVTSFSI